MLTLVVCEERCGVERLECCEHGLHMGGAGGGGLRAAWGRRQRGHRVVVRHGDWDWAARAIRLAGVHSARRVNLCT